MWKFCTILLQDNGASQHTIVCFITKNYKTENKQLGLSLHPNVEEACYFETANWIRNELGYDDVGRIWHKRYGNTLFVGRT